MDEKEILVHLDQMMDLLGKIEEKIHAGKWDAVGKLFSQVNKIETKLRKNPTKIDTIIKQNAAFGKEYAVVKEELLKKAEHVKTAIEDWRNSQMEKISSSKNVLDNISKYFNPKKSSYYIDKKE